ncbi:thioredoxin family protein [Flavobacteriaceae bacterium]|nr:thioredoxin family protein [Flavobacteriaceae bacterium]MDB4495996.1 thioredoxin family protein [Flavobacteriaceae bacterium]
MKKIIVFFLLISSLSYSQFNIRGTMSPTENSSWVLLYKIEGTKQIFVKNTQVKKEAEKGFFEFSLPNEAKPGTYRIKYSMKRNGFIDFFFNKEDVIFEFNPKDSNNTVIFKESIENQLYSSFTKKIYKAQFTLDSLQSEYFRNPSALIKEAYKKSLAKVKKVEKDYILNSKGKLVNHFIKASLRYNSPEIFERPLNYINSSIAHFFDDVDFSNKTLNNSTFLFDKISEYVLALNFAVDPVQKEETYKKSCNVAITKAKTTSFKADIINYLISQFSEIKNATLVDHLFANYFNKLPKENQNIRFKNKILTQLRIAIGRVAPEIIWYENDKELRLSSLKDGLNYVLIFYSTGCSHCLREVPEIYEYMKGKTNTKVIAFAMETSDDVWSNYRLKMPGWHHVLGLGKWENPTAKTYQINSTPSYFVLGMDKQIIAIPRSIDDLKFILDELN